MFFFVSMLKTDSRPLSSVPVESESQKKEPEEEDPMDIFYPQTLGGFIMVLTEEGDMIYLTENVNKYIGIVQVRSQPGHVEVIVAQIRAGIFSEVNNSVRVFSQFLFAADSWSCWARVFMTSSTPAIRRSSQTC